MFGHLLSCVHVRLAAKGAGGRGKDRKERTWQKQPDDVRNPKPKGMVSPCSRSI